MKKPPRAAWRSIRQRRSSRWLRSYQRRFAHQSRQPSCHSARYATGVRPYRRHGTTPHRLRAWLTCAAASTSAAPRSRRRSSTRAARCSGEARQPTPTERRPGGRRRGDGGGAARGGRGRRRRDRRPGRGRRRLARRRRREDRRRLRRPRNLPGWEGSFPLAEDADEALGDRGAGSATTSRSRPKPSSTSAPGSEFQSLIGVFWGTGVGGGLVLDGKPWLGRGAAGEIGHMVVKRGGAKCPCGRKGCMEAYAGPLGDGSRGAPPARRGRTRPTSSS